MHGYLRHLANFAHVVEAGSITMAAARMDSSASSMSESVKILEAHLGETLLERHKTGVTPTGRGSEVYQEAQQIVSALGRALGPRESETAATLRISLPSELAMGWFNDALAGLRQQHPELHLVLMVEDSVLDHTKYARDLHIRVGKPDTRVGLTELAQGTARAVMVAHADLARVIDPNDAESVSLLPFLGKPRPSGVATLRLSDGTELTFETLLQVSAVTSRIAMARDGLGVTTCLDRSVAADLQSGAMRRLCAPRFDYPVQISVSSPHRRPPEAARIVADALRPAIN